LKAVSDQLLAVSLENEIATSLTLHTRTKDGGIATSACGHPRNVTGPNPSPLANGREMGTDRVHW